MRLVIELLTASLPRSQLRCQIINDVFGRFSELVPFWHRSGPGGISQLRSKTARSIDGRRKKGGPAGPPLLHQGLTLSGEVDGHTAAAAYHTAQRTKAGEHHHPAGGFGDHGRWNVISRPGVAERTPCDGLIANIEVVHGDRACPVRKVKRQGTCSVLTDRWSTAGATSAIDIAETDFEGAQLRHISIPG